MKRSLALLWTVCFAVMFIGPTVALGVDDPISEHIDAKRFGDAIEAADSRPDERNQLFGRIALAQLESGESEGAKDTLRRISDPASLANATEQIQSAAGGANGADFQSLIDLITSTVAPNSWEEVGGPGAIAEFPGGVLVDAKGVLRKRESARPRDPSTNERLNRVRDDVKQTLASGDPRRQSDLRMVSLPRLQRELQLMISFGETPTEAMRHLAGLRQVQYLFLFPELNDCVIAGPAGDWEDSSEGQALLLDDLLTLMKNAEEGGRFGCSIHPKRDNLAETKRFLSQPTGPLKPGQTRKWVGAIRNKLGLQDIVVHGIDPRSHVAHVIVEADYHMKLVGMGLEPSVPGVPSYLAALKQDSLPKAMDVLRWWFTLHPESVQRNEQNDAFIFADQVVRLQSENEAIAADGSRVHTGQSSVLNRRFADRFTQHFDRLSGRYPVYDQLDQIFRLALVAMLLQNEDVASKIHWDPSWLTSTLTTAVGKAANEVPSIVNHRVVGRRHVVVGVSGGVTVHSPRIVKNMKALAASADVKAARTSAIPRIARHSEKWWWD